MYSQSWFLPGIGIPVQRSPHLR